MKTKRLHKSGCCVKNNLSSHDSTPLIGRRTRRSPLILLILVFAMVLAGCTKSNNSGEFPPIKTSGVYILNEGNYMAGNASLTWYSPKDGTVVDNAFSKANEGAPLGDIPTSMSLYKGEAYITLSNSGKIYVVDPISCKVKRKIIGLSSPRYICFISPSKAYVSNLWSPVIDIINPTTGQITGTVELGEGNMAEQFVVIGNNLYTNLWSNNTKLARIDIASNTLTSTIEVGIQPTCLYLDTNGKLWTLTDGGYEDNPVGYEDPQLIRIDPKEMKVEARHTMPREGSSIKMVMDFKGENLYLLNKNVYTQAIIQPQINPSLVVESSSSQNFYALGLDFENQDIYVSDALDYTQNGVVQIYDKYGKHKNSIKAGVVPGNFTFIPYSE